MVEKLSQKILNSLPGGIRRPSYDRTAVKTGIVHMGPGAFHRAHQAVYIDDILSQEKDWAICGVSLNSAGVKEALKDQDFLYTLVTLDQEISYRVIGSIKDILVAPHQPAQVLSRLRDPNTRIVTLTITEKGYCLGTDGALDFNHPNIQRDLSSPSTPVSPIGYIVESLRLRREAGVQPYTVVSCDNLMENGTRLFQAVSQYAVHISPDLATWIEDEACFPRTIVDSITPQTDDELRNHVTSATNIIDSWPVGREAFTQWIVEDQFSLGRPDWECAGVTMVGAVEVYAKAKLRLLNGAHSALAYLGILAGFDTVYEAINEEKLSRFIHSMMTREILPTLKSTSGFDLMTYIGSLLKRFQNPVIKHKLVQISSDGSQKLPIRILSVISENLEAGRPIERLCLVIAAWMQVIRRKALINSPIVDPLADKLIAIGWRDANGHAELLNDFLSLEAVFPASLTASKIFRTALTQAYRSLGSGEKSDAFKALE